MIGLTWLLGYTSCVDDCEGELLETAEAEAETHCVSFCAEAIANAEFDGSECAYWQRTDTAVVVNGIEGNVCHDPEAYAYRNMGCYWGPYNIEYARAWRANCPADEYDGYPLDDIEDYLDPDYDPCAE